MYFKLYTHLKLSIYLLIACIMAYLMLNQLSTEGAAYGMLLYILNKQLGHSAALSFNRTT